MGTIALRRGPVPDHLDGAVLAQPRLEVTPDEILIRPFLGKRALGGILIRAGREIVVAPARGAELELEPFILGSGIGGISLQQGLLPLHASAVSIGSGAIAFSGPTGAGKSTLAMTLAARGHALITDDLAVIDVAEDGTQLAYPSTTMIRLNPDSATALRIGGPGTATPGGKRRYSLQADAEPRSPLPLEAIYVLEQGPAIAIERLPQLHAFTAIAAEAYRCGWYAPMGVFEARMKDIAILSRRIGCFRIVRPHRFAALEEVADAVLAHHAQSLQRVI